jgi:hypothetical protein
MSSQGTRDNAPFEVTTAYSCFTSDVISGYCFGEPFGFLAQDDWEPNFRKPLNSLLEATFLFRFFPLLKVFTDVAPLFAKWLSDDIRNMLVESNERMPARVRKAKQDHKAGVTNARLSIFAAIIDSSLPEQEKTDVRLGGEGFSMISAGTETTAVGPISISILIHLLENLLMLVVDTHSHHLLPSPPTGNSG